MFPRRGAVTAYYVCLSTEDALPQRRKLHRLYANLPFTTIWDDCAVTAESPRHNLVAETYSWRDVSILSRLKAAIIPRILMCGFVSIMEVM